MSNREKIQAAVVVAGLLILAWATRPAAVPAENKSESPVAAQPAPAEPAASIAQPAALAPDWLVGSWVSAPKGGDDGQTVCGDFNAPSLYDMNGNTATIVTFRNDGQYRSLFAYTTPSGEEHTTLYKARWTLKGRTVNLTNVSTQDAFSFEGGSDTMAVSLLSGNVMLRGAEDGGKGERYVRCTGPSDDIYGE